MQCVVKITLLIDVGCYLECILSLTNNLYILNTGKSYIQMFAAALFECI